MTELRGRDSGWRSKIFEIERKLTLEAAPEAHQCVTLGKP